MVKKILSILISLVTDIHLFLLYTLRVHVCVSLPNVRKRTLYIWYLSSIIRCPSTGKKIAMELKCKVTILSQKTEKE